MNEITELNNEEIFHMCGQRDSTLSGVSSSQIDLWIKCYLSQNPGKFFCVCQKKKRERTRERFWSLYGVEKKIQFGQQNTEEQFCRTDVIGLQELL